jgi:hypothetical protein
LSVAVDILPGMRRALLAIGLSATLALTACGASSSSTSAPAGSSTAGSSTAGSSTAGSPGVGGSASAGADALTEIKAAVTRSSTTSSTFKITSDLGAMGKTTGTGSADPAAKRASYHADMTVQGQQLTIDSIQVGTDLYLKMPGLLPGTDPGKWSHLDTTKVKSLAKLGLDSQGNPTNLDVFANSVVSAQRTGPGAYTGVIDGTKNPAMAGNAAIATLGDALKSMPFEAELDDQGRLASLTNHTPAAGAVPATTTTIVFSDYGKPVQVAKPAAAQTQEIPADFYAALN